MDSEYDGENIKHVYDHFRYSIHKKSNFLRPLMPTSNRTAYRGPTQATEQT